MRKELKESGTIYLSEPKGPDQNPLVHDEEKVELLDVEDLSSIHSDERPVDVGHEGEDDHYGLKSPDQ